MVQTLSPNLGDRPQAVVDPAPGGATLLDRARRLVLPEKGDASARRSTPHAASRTAQRAGIVLSRLALGVCALLLLVAIGLFAFRIAYGDRIYPAVIVGDVEVGGLTRDAAMAKLGDRASVLEQQGVTFTWGGQTWTPTVAELGVEFQVDAALDEAQAFGRSGDAVERLAFTGDLLQEDQRIPLRSTLDPNVLNAWFDKVDQEMNQYAVDATLVVSGTEVTITPDKSGTIVDREAATRLIIQMMDTLQPVSAALPTKVQEPAVYAADLEPARERLSNSLGQHIRVEFGDESWRIEPDTISQFLIVEQTMVNGEVKVDVSVDEKGLGAYLREEFADDVNRAPTNAEVGWKDGQGLFATSESIDGTTMKAGEFAAAVAASFLGDHERVQIPVIVTKPAVDQNNLAALKIDGLIGRGDSNYDGSSDTRATNIGVGVNLLSGTLIGPGEEFSFNGAIGEITAEKGYVESSVVVAERVGKDVGGGICQVSTTVFRAALDAGMTIGEWHPHTYRIQNYEWDGWGPGFDASILQMGSDPELWADLTFTNNTDGYILIQSWTAYPHVIVEIFGHQDGRTVEIFDKYQSDPIPAPQTASETVDPNMPAGTWDVAEYALEGLEASFMYEVTDAAGNVITERYFYTYFKERGILYKVSPDMQGQSPAAG